MAEMSPYEKLLERNSQGGNLLFRCDSPGCFEDACFGHGVRLRQGVRGVHYCAAHNRAFMASQAARSEPSGGPRADGGPRSAGGLAPHAVPASPPRVGQAQHKHGEGPRPRGGAAADPRQSSLL